MKKHIRYIVFFIRQYVTTPGLIVYGCLVYIFYEFVFGAAVAHNFLSRVSSPVIPHIIRMRGGLVGRGTVIQSGIRFHNCRNFSNLEIGTNCHIGKEILIDLRGNVKIGDNVVIAMRCTLVTHFDMSNSDLSILFPGSYDKICIDDSSYIGCNVTILMGVHVSRRCIIGASSLLRSSTNPEGIYVGSPARLVRYLDGD